MDSFVFWKVTFGDLVSLLTLGVSVWIALTVQSNFTKNRFIREHFIAEITRLRDEYRLLFSELYAGNLSGGAIKIRLKTITLRVRNIEKFACAYYRLSDTKIAQIHADLQQFITGADEFNEQYKNKQIKFTSATTSVVQKYQEQLSDAITERIIGINSAKERSKKEVRQFLNK